MRNMRGLTKEEVEISRKEHGSNCMSSKENDSFFKQFLLTLGDPIIKILLIALAIKIIVSFQHFDWYETIGIVIAIFVASLISTISEYGSEKAFEKMQEESSKIKCRVKRDGKIKEVSIDDIVVGDLVLLQSGDKIPADGVLLTGEITVDESSMNGEAKEKYKLPVKKKIEEKNLLFRGTTVYSNEGMMLVKEVGMKTFYGKLALELQEKQPDSPLKIRLRDLAKVISKIGYFGAFFVSLSYLFSVVVLKNNFNVDLIVQTITNFPLMLGHFLYALTLSVTIIVVAVPEGLPMMITLVLSSNMKRMLKNNVLVRKMVGIETAGSLNILFTDKTGTLTKGKLEVIGVVDYEGNLYKSEKEIKEPYLSLFHNSILYNNASSYDGKKVIGGNITDRALLSFIFKDEKKYPILSTTPFDSKNKYSEVIVDQGRRVEYKKGAFEVLIKYCKYYYASNGEKKLLSSKESLYKKIESYTNNGIRVLAFVIDDCFLGFALIKDEIRKEALQGLKLVKKAHIQTVMITGDNKNTAQAIGKELGMVDEDSLVITSEEMNRMSDDEVKQILPNLSIVARSLPQDKSRLVRLAQELNLVVGMTGDGVNDAPALKKADVGFSMGSGTEVSKEASDIVILDDNFLSISKAILFGRTIFKSIRKFIIVQLTINLCAIGLSILGPFLGIDTPVTVIQMLWINMVMDTLAGLAFAFEPPLPEYMEELPKKKNEPIMNRYMMEEILFTGIYSNLLCLFFLKSPWIFSFYKSNYLSLMTAFFGLFIFIDIFNSFNARTNRLNILANITKNKVFLVIMVLVVSVQVLLIYFGGEVFRTTGLSQKEFLLMVVLAFTVIPVDILRKFILRLSGRCDSV